ncbi:MAG: response regulator [Kiloniellaceae bacterium]
MFKILCVEDEVDLRQDLVEMIEENGYEVASASNGAEGLLTLVRFEPDLVISDCLMPLVSGAEMLRKIRTELSDFSTIPVIFLSAHARKEQIEERMEIGASRYLAKPVDHIELLRVIAEVLGIQSDAAVSEN